ncbi:MAG: hypothetical protein ABFQ95_08300 [Pseudomonadota bacterium]
MKLNQYFSVLALATGLAVSGCGDNGQQAEKPTMDEPTAPAEPTAPEPTAPAMEEPAAPEMGEGEEPAETFE